MREQKLKRLLWLICLLMFVSSVFCAVSSKARIAQNFGGVNAACLLTTSYPPGGVPEARAIGSNSSVMYSKDGVVARRTTMLDVVEILPTKMRLSFSEAPALNCESRLSLILEPEIDAPNTTIHIILPEAFSLSSGTLQWEGDLSRNHIVQMHAAVRAQIAGNWCIEAIATSKPANDYPQVCSTQCYVQVTEAEACVFDVAPEDFVKAEAVKLDDIGSQKYAGESTSNLTVCGTWYYQDQEGRLKPIRYAMVQLWADCTPSNVCLATTYVQSDGYYEFPEVANNNDSLTDGYNIYVKLFCDSYQYQIVRVALIDTEDPRKPSVFYWSKTDTHYNVTDGHHDMGRWIVTGDKSECWAIYDNIVDGYFWLLEKAGWHRSEVRVTAQSKGGMSYSTGNGIILNLGDGWDRDTVLHEYGHCINYAAREGSFPPSNYKSDEHYPDSEIDGGWAFSEGWAEFFACAASNCTGMGGVNYKYGSIESTVYANGPYGHGDRGDWDGDIVEGAIAQVFWDIFDGVSPSDYPWWDDAYGDYISNEFGKLWDIFLNHDPNNIHDFWAQWNPKDARIWAIFHHARILEPRNIVTMNVCPSQPSIVLGETAYVNITVRNQGDTAENFDLTASANNFTIGSFQSITLESRSSVTLTVWNITGTAKGDYTISARAITIPKDLNATDDVNACVIAVLSPGHDVGISSVVPSKTVIGQGYSLSITMKAKNCGIFPETFILTGSINSTTIDTFSNISLANGDSTMFTLNWNTTSYPKGNYTVRACITPLEDEVDISDNTLTAGVVKVTIPGDINGDFSVNNSDLDQIRLCWQQRSPSTPLNADINGDGLVNIKDATIVGLNWLKQA